MSERRRSLAFTAALALLLVPVLGRGAGPAPLPHAGVPPHAALHHAGAEFVWQAPLPVAGLPSAAAEGPPTPRDRGTSGPTSTLLERLTVPRAAAARRLGSATADALVRAGIDAWHTTAGPPLRFA